MDRPARHLWASMLLTLGAVPLTGCGAAPSDVKTTAGHADGAPALLDIGATAGSQVRQIDPPPAMPLRVGPKAAKPQSPALPVIQYGSAEVVASPVEPSASDRSDSQPPQRLADLSRIAIDDIPNGLDGETGRVATGVGGLAIEPLPACDPARPLAIQRDDSILPIEEAAAAPIEQTELPWARASINNEALAPVLQQAYAFSRRAFELADRGAHYSARAEFTGALRLVAEALDVQQQTTHYTRSLAAGIAAIKEADDFSPQSQRGQIDLARTIAGHATPLLKNQSLDGLSPLVARQRYLSYAKEQLSAASGMLPACSLALFGMGQVTLQSAPRDPAAQLAATGRAMVWHQAALQADPRNFRSANELGVLLAKNGDAAGARTMFEQSLSVSSQPPVWANLAEVQQRLGNTQHAAYSRQQAELVSRSGSAAGLASSIRWVDPTTFARTGGADVLTAPTPSVKQPQETAAAPKPPKKSLSSWNLWNGSLWR